MSMPTNKLRIIALVCERSVNFKSHLTESGHMKACDAVKIIKVPCSGIIQPAMIEGALKQGADGVIATGCRIGDCHYREGNKFLKERLEGNRAPKLKPSVDRNKIRAYWLSALEYNLFKEMAETFYDELAGTAAVS
jgi:F420-non-reducing hydrogenase iron-sulfur subunit